MLTHKPLLAAAVASAFLATACGKFDQSTAPAAPAAPAAAPAASDQGPVVAKVNGMEIREAQVGAVLAKIPNIPAEKTKEAAKQVLDKLIDETLVLQQAKEKKLESDPKVAQALQAARNQILTQAFLEQATANTPKPTDAEIKDFYDKNPALFKERKVYNLRELQVQAAPGLAPQLEATIAKAKSLEEVGNWLKEHKHPFNVNAAVKPAEQLPMELLPRFAAAKDGGVILVNAGNVLLVEQVAGSRPQPVDEAAAKPVIERILTGQKRNEAAAKEVKSLREKAKVELQGDYAAPAAVPVRPN